MRELAERAGARLLSALGVLLSRHIALRALLRLARPVLRALGVDQERVPGDEVGERDPVARIEHSHESPRRSAPIAASLSDDRGTSL
ncbi:hypothetical protein [Actinomadura rubrisoli]|uniref:hypothetical protein n=1 Tax=Actinomadura rubrisoli TaxID=2530368 RepID=UPI001A9E25F2